MKFIKNKKAFCDSTTKWSVKFQNWYRGNSRQRFLNLFIFVLQYLDFIAHYFLLDSFYCHHFFCWMTIKSKIKINAFLHHLFLNDFCQTAHLNFSQTITKLIKLRFYSLSSHSFFFHFSVDFHIFFSSC